MASAGVKSDVLLYLILDLVDEFVHLVFLQYDALVAEDVDDLAAGVLAFLGGDEQTYSGSGNGTADY